MKKKRRRRLVFTLPKWKSPFAFANIVPPILLATCEGAEVAGWHRRHPVLVDVPQAPDTEEALVRAELLRTFHQRRRPELPRGLGPGVYLVELRPMKLVKIGFSKDVHSRLTGNRAFLPGDVDILAWAPGDYGTENMLHSEFRRFRVGGEWFVACGEIYRRFAALPDAVLAEFPNTDEFDPFSTVSTRNR